MVRTLVEKVLSDALNEDASVLDKNVFADIILKKVA